MILCYNTSIKNDYMKQTIIKKLSKKDIQKAVANSSKIEGLSWHKAKKNNKAIKILKKYGRAFSI